VVAAGAAIAALVAVAVSTAGQQDRTVWRGNGEVGLGIDNVSWLLIVALIAGATGAVVAGRASNTEAATLRAGAIAAAVFGICVFVVELLATRDGADLNLQPDEAFWWMLNVGGAFALALFLAPVLAPGLAKLARLGIVTAAFSAAFMTTWAAAFQDNADSPTPPLLALVVLLAPLVLASAYRYTAVATWISATVLVVHLGGLVSVLHNAVVCHDDDCSPVSFSLQMIFVATIWGASAWISDDKHTDFVLKN